VTVTGEVHTAAEVDRLAKAEGRSVQVAAFEHSPNLTI